MSDFEIAAGAFAAIVFVLGLLVYCFEARQEKRRLELGLPEPESIADFERRQRLMIAMELRNKEIREEETAKWEASKSAQPSTNGASITT